MAYRNDHDNIVKLLLNQDIENAFEIITKESQGNGCKSLLQDAIKTKWNKLGQLIFYVQVRYFNIYDLLQFSYA